MGTGFLKIQLFVGDFALHGDSVTVQVLKDGQVLHELQTDENGNSTAIPLPAPQVEAQTPEGAGRFETYDVHVPAAHGYKAVTVHGTQIFDAILSILPVHLEPFIPSNPDDDEIDIYVPGEHGTDVDRTEPEQPTRVDYAEAEADYDGDDDTYYGDDNSDFPPSAFPRYENFPNRERLEEFLAREALPIIAVTPPSPATVPVANDITIPDFITVHLGRPDAAAPNVRIRFRDYIANVASSEIYPFWNQSAIEANVYAQISFALNRLFTRWYPSRGRAFDITNTTQVSRL